MLTRNTLALTLLAASFGACATNDAQVDDPTDTINGLSPDQIAALRQPASPEVKAAQDQAFAARMSGEGDRAQAYLDQFVIPDFDRALRATSNVDYATLHAEILAALRLQDPDAIKARIDQFYAVHGAQIDAALASMGMTAAEVAERIRLAAVAGEVSAPPPAQMPHTRGRCGAGIELEPVPPYADTGTFSNGASLGGGTATLMGAVTASASVVAGWGNGGAWVRSDNLPPVGAGWTMVIANASFSSVGLNLMLWAPAYSGAGVGLTVEAHDGGPQGPLLGSCRQPLLDRSTPFGFISVNVAQTAAVACLVRHAATPFITTKVIVDAYAVHTAPWAGAANSFATGVITSIAHNTCLD